MLSPIELCERGLVPDALARAGMRRLIQKRLDDEVIETTDDFYVYDSTKHELYTDDDVNESIGTDIDRLKDLIPERQAKVGSNWIFIKVVTLEAHVVKHTSFRPRSHVTSLFFSKSFKMGICL